MSHAHFSGPPAMPTTRQPRILPSWPAIDPTAPAAPDTTTVSLSFVSPTSIIPKYAVSPVTPYTLRYAVTGSWRGTAIIPSGPEPAIA